MVPVAIATGELAMDAESRWGGEGGEVKEFSEDWPHRRNLKETKHWRCYTPFGYEPFPTPTPFRRDTNKFTIQ